MRKWSTKFQMSVSLKLLLLLLSFWVLFPSSNTEQNTKIWNDVFYWILEEGLKYNMTLNTIW